MKKNILWITIFLVLGLAACTPSTEESLPGPGAGQTAEVESPAIPTETPGSVGGQTPAVETPGAGNPLMGTLWTLVSFTEAGAETPVLPGTNITLEFDQNGQAGGSSGCNYYGASYQVQDRELSLEAVSTTLMACTGSGVMEQEERFHQALKTAAEFELAGDELKIRYNQGQDVLTFTRAQPGAADTEDPLANTQWVLESFGPTGAAAQVLAGTTITLEFEAGGSGGCNSYRTEYEVENGAISFGEVASTRRVCADEAATRQEQSFFQALQAADGFQLIGDRLTISYDNGQGFLYYVRNDQAPVGGTATPPA